MSKQQIWTGNKWQNTITFIGISFPICWQLAPIIRERDGLFSSELAMKLIFKVVH